SSSRANPVSSLFLDRPQDTQRTRACQSSDRSDSTAPGNLWVRLSRMFRFGFWELLILVFVVLLIFGPKRLPQMGRSMGGAIRGFKDSITHRIEKQDAEAEAEQAAQLPPTATQPQLEARERDTVV